VVTAVAAAAWRVLARDGVCIDLVEATCDMYRGGVYQRLRQLLPATPAEEQESGGALSRYLVRGSSQVNARFTLLSRSTRSD
jgi:hypothetical protein